MEVAKIALFGDPALVNGISEPRRLSIHLDSGDYGSHSLPGTRQPTRHGPQPNWAPKPHTVTPVPPLLLPYSTRFSFYFLLPSRVGSQLSGKLGLDDS